MSPNDIQSFLRRQPFEPFRLHAMDGTSYDIHHPELCMVLATSVIVAIPSQSGGFPEDVQWIDARHIHKLIPMPRQTA